MIVNEFGEVGIGYLMKLRDRFAHLVIETTGLADPAPVIQTFFVDDDLRDELRLDAVVTLVDLRHVLQHWQADEVQEQLAFADVLLLNKADLVDEAERAAAHQRRCADAADSRGGGLRTGAGPEPGPRLPGRRPRP